MLLIIFLMLYVVWVVGPEWDFMKLVVCPKWLQNKNKGKINKNY